MLATKARDGGASLRAQRIEIDAARVRDLRHRADPFLEPLDRRAALPARDVMHAGAELQEHAYERHLVAHGFEEELLEEVGGFEPVAGCDMCERGGEARIVFQRRQRSVRQARSIVNLRRLLRGLPLIPLLLANLMLWGTLVFLGGFVKLLTFGAARRRVILALAWLAERWVAVNDFLFDTFLATRWDIDGFETLRRDGRYLVISNHLSWIDIFALFRVLHGHAPFIRFFLKHALIWFPFAGQACWSLEFPFMRRYSPEYLAAHPEKRGRDLQTTQIACRRYRDIPVTIANFVEGTRFTRAKHAAQQSPYRYLLRPRVGGVGFVLASMAEQLDAVYDVTIVYPAHEDATILSFVLNRVPRVIVRGRRLDVPREFYDDAITQPGPERERFKGWIEAIWREKDAQIASLVESSTSA